MILISAYTRRLEGGKPNPKDYPWWPQLIEGLTGPIVQVATPDDPQLVPDCRTTLSFAQLGHVLDECEFWISCDSMLQHLGWQRKKLGVVLWGPSNPAIFGHAENINIHLGDHVLVPDQFLMWSMQEYKADRFVPVPQVLQVIKQHWPHRVK